MKNLRKKITLAAIIGFGAILTSCSTTIDIAKKRHSKGYYVSISKGNKIEKSKSVDSKSMEKQVVASTVETINQKTTVQPIQSEKVLANVSSSKAVVAKKNVIDSKVETKKPSLLSIVKATKKLKKEIKSGNSITADSSDDVDQIVLIILAIFIPPLAVFLVKGIGNAFWINLILTLLLFWLPGAIHAILIVLGKI